MTPSQDMFDQRFRSTSEQLFRNEFSRRHLMRGALLAGLSVGPLGSILAACGGGGSSSGSGVAQNSASNAGILIAPPVSNNIYWDGWTNAAKAAATALGMNPHVENFHGDTNSQINSFQNAKSLNLKGALSMANVAAVSPRLFGILQNEQIYGVNAHSNQPYTTPFDVGDHYAGYWEYAYDFAYEQMCTFLFQKMNGTGKILNVSGVAGVLASEYRDFGLNAALKNFPGIQLVDKGYGNFSRTVAQPLVENMLTAHPDVQGIVCNNDDSALGAITALKKKGVKAYVVGSDGVPEMLDAISSGDALASVANSAPWLGGAMVVRLFDAINGVKFDTLERMQRFEAFTINTPAAAQAYKDLMYTGVGPYDFTKMSRFLHPTDWDMQIGIKQIHIPDYWTAYYPQPTNYQAPAPYKSATSADYDKLDGLYKDHLKSNKFDPVKAKAQPLFDTIQTG